LKYNLEEHIVHEILRNLHPGLLVLDLGSAQGSFSIDSTPGKIVRLDRTIPQCTVHTMFVQADAGELPFANSTFAAVVANHSLEHINDVDRSLSEIGRVLVRNGCLFVSVPDASTLTDKLYRWLASGGGHVNAFTSPDDLAKKIESGTGLRLVAMRTLYSSLSFLNPRNSPRPRSRRLILIGGGHEWSLFLYTWLSRRIDRVFNLRTSVYGWAFYFGEIADQIDTKPSVNVCIRCGSGCSVSVLRQSCLVRSFIGIRVFRCPDCGAMNPFTDN
jgi:SAM-dependent methyltransferase